MKYELVYILSPKLTDEEAKEKAAEIKTMIGKEADKVTMEDFWGKRGLAYPIEHYDNGYYVVVQFTDESGSVNNIDKNLRLTDEIIRFLLVKKDKIVRKKKTSQSAQKDEVVDKAVSEKVTTSPEDLEKDTTSKAKRSSKPKAGIDDLDKKLDDILGGEIKD